MRSPSSRRSTRNRFCLEIIPHSTYKAIQEQNTIDQMDLVQKFQREKTEIGLESSFLYKTGFVGLVTGKVQFQIIRRRIDKSPLAIIIR